MAKGPPPPRPRHPYEPDPSKPCAACRHYQAPSYWGALLLGRRPTCTSVAVRGVNIDLVTGRSELRAPPECEFARRIPLDIYGGGSCGPRGAFWRPRDA
jgi:hypothetical protein